MTGFAALLTLLAAQEIGWRGDGSGKAPGATPPSTWSRLSRPVQGLRYRAEKPGPNDAGAPMADGVIREWLVLSPAPPGIKVDKEVVPDEATLSPVAGESWKKVALETAWLDFTKVLGKAEKSLGCAATHVYSETGGKFRINVTQLAGLKLLVNGKAAAGGYGRYSADLVPGWNRLLVKVAPRDAEWAFTLSFHPVAPAEFESKGIAWTTALPGVQGGYYGGGTGCGSPIAVGDRLYLLSEPYDLVCLDKATGKVLWVRTNGFFDAASEKDKASPAYAEAAPLARRLQEVNESLTKGPLSKAALEEKSKLETDLQKKMEEVDEAAYKKGDVPDVGFSGLTPTSDGRAIYLWLASGVSAAYDLDGKRKWIRVDRLPMVEHGFSSSPLLIDGKLVVFMRDLFAFDAATGKQAWRIPVVAREGANPGGYFHGSMVRATVGGVPLVVLGNGTLVRASDGAVVFKQPGVGSQSVSSPVVDGNRLLQATSVTMQLQLQTLSGFKGDALEVAIRTISVNTPGFPHYYLPWYLGSPVVHEGLAYLLNNAGVLTVVDVEAATVVYQRMLDLDHFQTSNEGAARGIGTSPILAGKHLYFFGNSGSSLVVEPGRTYKQVAKNRIENIVSIGHWGERQERFVATPLVDGNRLYVRGEGHLYAIGP